MEKRERMGWGGVASKLLSIVCALSLVTSLVPTQVTYAAESEGSDSGTVASVESDDANEEAQEDSFAPVSDDNAAVASVEGDSRDNSSPSTGKASYAYQDSQGIWNVTVKTAASGMPSTDGNITLAAASEADCAAAKAWAAASYEGDPEPMCYAFALPGGSALPSDAEVSVTYTGGMGLSADSAGRAFALGGAGELGDELAVANTERSLMGFMTYYTLDFDLPSGSTSFALLKTDGLTEKAAGKASYAYQDSQGIWNVTVKTAASGMPSTDGNITLAAASEADCAAAKAWAAASYEGDPEPMCYAFALPGGSALPSDAEVSVTYTGGMGLSADSAGRAFALGGAGELGDELAVANTERSLMGFMTYYTLDFDLPSGSTSFALLKTDGLTEKAAGLEPGTYTVNANPYVDGENNIVLSGVTVYLCSPFFPPVSPVVATNNASLVVNDDRTMDLTLTFDNTPSDIFVQTSLGSSDTLEVKDVQYKEGQWGSYAGKRVYSITVRLANSSGEYAFGNCSQWPTPIDKATNMPVNLSVDFSSTVRSSGQEGIFEKKYEDEKSGIAVSVKTDDDLLKKQLADSGLNITEASTDAFASQLAEMYKGQLNLNAFNAAIVSKDGQTVGVDGKASLSVDFPVPNDASIVDVFYYDGSSLKEIGRNVSTESNHVSVDGVWSVGASVDSGKLGTFVVVDKDSASRWFSKTIGVGDQGVMDMTWAMTDVDYKHETDTGGPEAKLGQIVSTAYSDASKSVDVSAVKDSLKASFVGSFDNVSIESVFSFGLNHFFAGNNMAEWHDGGNSYGTMTVRDSKQGMQAFYIEQGTNGLWSAVKLPTSIADGVATIEICPSSMTSDDVDWRMGCLYKAAGSTSDKYAGYNNGYIVFATGMSADTKTATYEDGDVSLKISSDRLSVAPLLESAKFSAGKQGSESSTYDAVRRALINKFNADPSFVAYDMALVDQSGQNIGLNAEDNSQVTISSSYSDPEVYTFSNGVLSYVESSFEDGAVGFSPTGLNTFVVIDKATAIEKTYSKQTKDEATGVTITASTKNPLVGIQLDKGELTWSIEKITDKDAISSSIEDYFELRYKDDAQPNYVTYKVDLLDVDGNKLSQWSGDLDFEFSVPSAYQQPQLLSWKSSQTDIPQNGDFDQMKKLENTDGVVSFTRSASTLANRDIVGMYDAAGASKRDWVKFMQSVDSDGDGATDCDVVVNSYDPEIAPLLEGAYVEVKKLTAGNSEYDEAARFFSVNYVEVPHFEVWAAKLVSAYGEEIDLSGDRSAGRKTIALSKSGFSEMGYVRLYAGGLSQENVDSPDSTTTARYDSSNGSLSLDVTQLGTFVVSPYDQRSNMRKSIAVPSAKIDLVANGQEQVGVDPGEGYSLEGDYKATEPGTYTAYAVLDASGQTNGGKGYRWNTSDEPLKEKVAITWTLGKSGSEDTSTTYSVTANLSMPGEYNPVLSGVTVYVNNPNNPFTDKAGNSPVLDGGSAEGVQSTAPTTPMADNATITVAPDGTKTLTLDLPNPVFTLQDLGTCEALPDVKVGTKEPADKSVWDYGKYDTRICRIAVTLPADADTTGVQTYTFAGSKLYAAAPSINLDIQPEAGKPALNLTIDYSTVKTSKAVDASALTSAVADAKKLAEGATVSVNGSDVSSEGTWVTKEALQSLNDAIAKASAVAGSNLLSQQMVADATEALQAAVDTFKAAAKPGTKDERVKVEKPSAVGGLVYTGSEQAGVASAEGYTLSGASATDAGAYTAKATLKAGFVWADGSDSAVEISWSIAKAKLTATYAGETVSSGDTPQLGVEVGGFVGGETVLTAKGYKAPTVTAPDALEAGKSYDLIPAGGEAANYEFAYVGGKLIVEQSKAGTLKAGTYDITANLCMPGEYNPVISGATVYANNPNNPFADNAGNTPVLDGNSADGVAETTPTSPLAKNAKLVVAADGSKTLELDILNPVFTTQKLGTCAELPNVVVTTKAPADASVWSYGKYSTRISHISVPLTDDMVTGVKTYTFAGSKLYAVPLGLDIAPSGDVALQLSVNYSSLPSSALPDGVTPDPDVDPTPGPSPAPTPSPTPSPAPTPSGSTEIETTADGHFAAGTYTVSANLWFDKSVTGLPLNPHLTNSGFPPSTPVSRNATLTVDASGHAWVSIPVVIQDKVMTINNVWGSGVSYNGSTVTIDLGTPSSSQTQFMGTCSSSVTIGWLARTIAAGIFNGVWDHTWTTNWEIDFGSALPASGGGSLPAAAQAILDGLNGVSDEQSAAEAALSALDESGSAGSNAKSTSSQAKKAGQQGEGAEEAASDGGMNAAVVAGVVCGVVALAALGAWLLLGRKKRNGATDEEK